jgi:hypothetical protein
MPMRIREYLEGEARASRHEFAEKEHEAEVLRADWEVEEGMRKLLPSSHVRWFLPLCGGNVVQDNRS